MTAAPVPEPDSDFPAWLIPPPEGFSAADLDRLPNLPPHTELIDGSLVFESPQAKFHMRVLRLLEAALVRQAPADISVLREMTITIARDQRPEPDLMVVPRVHEGDDNQTSYLAEHVILAVEVMSPDSRWRDRERKPRLYASAGIRHYWRVENVDGRPVAYVYELDPATGKYALSGIHHDRLRLAVPFVIDIDLTVGRGDTAQ